LPSSKISKCKKNQNLLTSICNSNKNVNNNNNDDFDKDYEYDNHDESSNNYKELDDEEDNFTNDIDLKYDQEHSISATAIAAASAVAAAAAASNRKSKNLDYIYTHTHQQQQQHYHDQTDFNLNTSNHSHHSSLISKSQSNSSVSSSSCSSCSSCNSIGGGGVKSNHLRRSSSSNSNVNTANLDSVSDVSDDEDENDDDDDDEDTEYNSEKLYDYELEHEEDTYFDKYDYDINSNCCKLSSIENHPNLDYAADFNNLNKHHNHNQFLHHTHPDIDTIIKSISSLTTTTNNNNIQPPPPPNESKSTQPSPPLTLNAKSKYKSMNHLIYEKLNRQRLELVDLLLKHGADKYLVTKLSITNLERLDKKSFNMLKKWYGISKTQMSANAEAKAAAAGTTATPSSVVNPTQLTFSLDPNFSDVEEEVDEKKYSESEERTDEDDKEDEEEEEEEEEEFKENASESPELRPLSPMLASLCLDDVEIFSRLYKHHQTLFTYFKPDEDYELIYYAIRFQSKKCLIYLLCSMNNDLDVSPKLLTQQSSSSSSSSSTSNKLATSLSLPMSLNKADTFSERSVKQTMTGSLKLSQQQKQQYHKGGGVGGVGGSSSMLNFQQQINKNVNTMFYIIENTRSSEIIKVLLKCGFDLCKREPLTGNTTLHCLFNANMMLNKGTTATTKSSTMTGHSKISKKINDINNNRIINKNKTIMMPPPPPTTTTTPVRKILNEFRTPKSLSKILFIMLKHGGLKSHVNTLNYEKKLCLQNLFEWTELIETVFFETNMKTIYKSHTNENSRSEWQKEFKECLRLLLKSGADLLLLNTSSISTYATVPTGECELVANNCIQTLITSILKSSINTESCDPQTNKFQMRFYSNNNSSDMGDILHSNTTTSNENLIKRGATGLALNMMRQRSPSLPLPPDRSLLHAAHIGNPGEHSNMHTFYEDLLMPKKTKFELNKTIDIEFMYHLFNEVIDLAGNWRFLTITNLFNKVHYSSIKEK
jgi:hypothetical protein